MRPTISLLSGTLALSLVLLPAPASAQGATDSNGTFRFLNGAFPPLSTNGPVFTGQLVVANADGTVTFSVDPASAKPLPAGLLLDPESGMITGIPTSAGNDVVTFRADDGTQFIQRDVTFSVSSSGGGGNGGSGLSNPVFPDATVGTAYTFTLTPDGDGPFTFGGSDLPPGLSLNGQTGELSGTPTSAGTWFMSLTVRDAPPNEENIGTAIVPIRILPAGSTLAFVTKFLNNGEIGTPFIDQYVVENATGPVTFSATGLPPGLQLDAATGAVSGTPTEPGTFLVTLGASDGADSISTNRSMIIATTPTSEFHWDYLGLPAAFLGTPYDRVPPIVMVAEAAPGAVEYAATGLPAGIGYDPLSGELTGTPAQVGEFPVTFTAVSDSETIRFDTLFIILPPTGGDVMQISVNLWVSKTVLKLGADGKESWTGSVIYNADRRTGLRFDPATDTFAVQLGARTIALDPGSLTGKVPDQDCAFKSPAGELPVVHVHVSADKQLITWSSQKDALQDAVPGELSQQLSLGDAAWHLVLVFDAKGHFRPALGLQRTSFVVSGGTLSVGSGAGDGSAKLKLLLADPAFAYEAGASTLRVRLLDGETVLLDRDATALGGPAKSGIDAKTGKPWVSFKTLPDETDTDRVALSYSSRTGALKLTLTKLDLTAITPGEVQLEVEITVGERVYQTFVTFFEKSGKYGLAIP